MTTHDDTSDTGASGPTHPAASARNRPCPTCGRPVGNEALLAPFCSDRCRLADLGRWFSGDYVISREVREEDLGPDGPPKG